MSRRSASLGVSFAEVIIAMFILMMALVPMMDLFGTTGKAVQKSQNLGIAVGLAHKVAQHLMTMPFDDIIVKSATPISDAAADDGIFNPLENTGSDASSNKRITVAQLPELRGFLRKYDFKYALDVVGVQPKDVKIQITWVEGNRDLMYSLQVYVAQH